MIEKADGPAAWSDADVERALRELFRHEMPADLRQWPERSTSDPSPLAMGDARPRRGAAVGVGVVAATLALTLIAIRYDSQAGPADRHEITRTHAPAEVPRDSSSRLEEAPDPPIVVELVPPPTERSPFFVVHERRATPDGPVELRIEKRTDRVQYVDPESGAAFEMEYPEFEIEVYPVEDE